MFAQTQMSVEKPSNGVYELNEFLREKRTTGIYINQVTTRTLYLSHLFLKRRSRGTFQLEMRKNVCINTQRLQSIPFPVVLSTETKSFIFTQRSILRKRGESQWWYIDAFREFTVLQRWERKNSMSEETTPGVPDSTSSRLTFSSRRLLWGSHSNSAPCYTWL